MKISAIGYVLAVAVPAACAAVAPKLNIQIGAKSPAQSIAFGRNPLLASMDGGRIKLWDSSTGYELRTLDIGPRGSAEFVFTPSGDHIISANTSITSGKIKVWDVNTGRELHAKILPGEHTGSAVLSPDGRWLGTIPPGSAFLNIWDIDAERGLFSITADSQIHEGTVAGVQKESRSSPNEARWRQWCLAFSEDGRLLATWQRPQHWDSGKSTIRSDHGPRRAQDHGPRDTVNDVPEL